LLPDLLPVGGSLQARYLRQIQLFTPIIMQHLSGNPGSVPANPAVGRPLWDRALGDPAVTPPRQRWRHRYRARKAAPFDADVSVPAAVSAFPSITTPTALLPSASAAVLAAR